MKLYQFFLLFSLVVHKLDICKQNSLELDEKLQMGWQILHFIFPEANGYPEPRWCWSKTATVRPHTTYHSLPSEWEGSHKTIPNYGRNWWTTEKGIRKRSVRIFVAILTLKDFFVFSGAEFRPHSQWKFDDFSQFWKKSQIFKKNIFFWILGFLFSNHTQKLKKSVDNKENHEKLPSMFRHLCMLSNFACFLSCAFFSLILSLKNISEITSKC